MQKLFFKDRTVTGFYLPLVGALLSLVSSILYQVHYTGSNYYSLWVFLLSLFAFVSFSALLLFKKTEIFASLAQETFSFISLLVFILNTYLYLSTVFYAGVNAESIASMDKIFVCVFLFDLISIIFSNIGIYHRPSKTTETNKESVDHD